ncbi:AAA family ATPase [Cellulomonas sp.]|uniref:AAA family ATPase n=1 Tax=Cellulomonas sp. TaxID=40001 RepID=UPI003BACD6D7
MARGSMSTPFVAHALQVDQLTLALQRAGVGEPSTVLIGADAGVGKTRLLRHVAELADAAGARVVVAHCVDLGEIGLPYLPFAEALSQLHALDPDTVDAVIANRPALARLLPGPSGSATAPDDQANRLQLFDGLVEAFSAVAQSRGTRSCWCSRTCTGRTPRAVTCCGSWSRGCATSTCSSSPAIARTTCTGATRGGRWPRSSAATPAWSGSTCPRSPTTSSASSPPPCPAPR